MRKRIWRRSAPSSRSLSGPFAAALFADWLKRNQQRFLIQPQLIRAGRHGSLIGFSGISSAISASLDCDKDGGLAGINIHADYRGYYWGNLSFMETLPRRQGDA